MIIISKKASIKKSLIVLFPESLYLKNDDYFSLKKTKKMIVFYQKASIAEDVFSKKNQW